MSSYDGAIVCWYFFLKKMWKDRLEWRMYRVSTILLSLPFTNWLCDTLCKTLFYKSVVAKDNKYYSILENTANNNKADFYALVLWRYVRNAIFKAGISYCIILSSCSAKFLYREGTVDKLVQKLILVLVFFN